MIPKVYINKIKDYFKGDEKKSWVWWQTKNPAFGMVSPLEMVKRGQMHKVKQFIDNAIDEDKGFYP